MLSTTAGVCASSGIGFSSCGSCFLRNCMQMVRSGFCRICWCLVLCTALPRRIHRTFFSTDEGREDTQSRKSSTDEQGCLEAVEEEVMRECERLCRPMTCGQYMASQRPAGEREDRPSQCHAQALSRYLAGLHKTRGDSLFFA